MAYCWFKCSIRYLNTTICSLSLSVLRSFTREFFKSNVKQSVDFPSSNEYSYLLHRSSIRFNQIRSV
ncbi:hypothetical protein MRB53_013210 [Persea americana]|uniref:Uncharacterized protein n=1 Tax=Persea americana TaxID=3435 RepID=A0ACC2K7U3_PERAE|nr:hypothetical protein MRB53_013210 [Persea americana]